MTHSEEQSGSLSPLKLAFLKLQRAEARIRELEALRAGPIAIVGMGCRFPGAEGGPDAYWRLIRDQRCAVSEGLEQRLSRWVGPISLPGSARCAALVRDVDLFDPQHFRISPREAAAMDPQQRVLLEVSWEALEHAGIDPGSLYQTRAGVYVGITSHDYAQLQMRTNELHDFDVHFASGTALSVAAGRIAYTLGLNGPAMSVDTACSSSLVAVHLACEALRGQECSVALAGGVNLILAPEASVAFAQAGMLSARGACSPFLASADGFVRGEGCGIVVLKRLADAEASGDRIMAVIAGSAVNQDGASSGLTAPNGLAQQALLREAYHRAGIEPSEVGYIETHAIGSKLGDPVEAEALGQVFMHRSERLVIGSVKANIGHLESASGVAGLIKLVLSLEHGEIPGQSCSTGLSEHIRWQELPLKVSTQLRSWQEISGRRIGGVSSFGFSGTNAHVVVEGWPTKQQQQQDGDRLDVLCISARTKLALRELAAKYATSLRDTPWNWSEICHTAGIGRAVMAERLAVLAVNRISAREKLEEWLLGKVVSGVYRNGGKASVRHASRDLACLPPETLAELFIQGGNVDWNARGAGRELRRAELPTYPFQRERYWFKEQGHRLALDTSNDSAASRSAAPPFEDLRLLLSNMPAEQRLGIIRNYLKIHVATVLALDSAAGLDEDQQLTELGMDSLMALELKNSLQQSCGTRLPTSFMFAYPTIRSAAIYLNAIIGSVLDESSSASNTSEFEDMAL